jgi:hypothetical protein
LPGVRPELITYAEPGLPPPYASAHPRAKVYIALAWTLVALQILSVWPAVHSAWHGPFEYVYGDPADDSYFFFTSPADVAATVLGLAYLVAYVVAVVFWCMWMHRTYRNLPALGAAGLRWTPGWVVGYWFIPVLNLFRPYQVMSETWRASDPLYTAATDWKALSAPALLVSWWAMHVLYMLAGGVMGYVGVRSEDPGVLLTLARVELAFMALDVSLLLLEIRIVKQLTARQERRADASGIPSASAILAASTVV